MHHHRAGRAGRAGRVVGGGLKLFVEMLKPVVEHAEKEGVLLLVEPEPGLLIETADQFLEFMRHIDSPAVGLNFDIGHFYCVGDDPAATVRRLAKYIRHVHLEDIAATRVHHHLIPGEGAIDFAATSSKRVRDIGYDGWVTIELYPYVDDPDAAARTAFEYVRRAVADVAPMPASAGIGQTPAGRICPSSRSDIEVTQSGMLVEPVAPCSIAGPASHVQPRG